MRRIAASTLIALIVAACTTVDVDRSGPRPSSTSPTADSPVITSTTLEPCRDATTDLEQHLAELGLGDVDISEIEEAIIFHGHLPDANSFGADLGMDCTGVFAGSSPFGEAVEVVAAWDESATNIAIGALVEQLPSDVDDEAIVVSFDGAGVTRLTALGDDLMWGTIHDWWANWMLEGIAVVGGPDPLAVLGSWNRVSGDGLPQPLLQVTRSGGWGIGADIPSFTLYEDGMMLVASAATDYVPTFGHGVSALTLTQEQVLEVIEMGLATGIVEGESFALPERSWVDAQSLGIYLRHGDVTYLAGAYAPEAEEQTIARQQLVDLEAHLDGLRKSLEPAQWIPETFVVKVGRHGPFSESNTMAWPGVFDLEEAAERLCTLLEGDEAIAYLEDVALIGDEYQDRFKTIFDFNGATYSVQAIPLLPEDVPERADELRPCSTGGTRQADPVIAAGFWDLRGIYEYRSFFAVECSLCNDEPVLMENGTRVSIPGWAELYSINDIFELAQRDDLELVEFVTDGTVGVPVFVTLNDPLSGDSLSIKMRSFTTDEGSISIGNEDHDNWSGNLTGFDQWRLEGY